MVSVFRFTMRKSLAGILILCMILFMRRWLPPVATTLDQTVSYIVYPIIYAEHAIIDPCKRFVNRIAALSSAYDELEQLKQEKYDLTAALIKAQTTQDFLENNTDLITFQKRYSAYTKYLGHIIMRHLADREHFFLVDKGSKHGIERDMIAVYKNCLIGRVSEVYPWHCKVSLITDAACKVAAFCARTKAKGILEGINNNRIMYMSHVSHLQSVENNDLVISSGDGLVFPRGFGLGRVRYHTVDGVYHSIRLAPLIDIEHLNYCYLMKKGAE